MWKNRKHLTVLASTVLALTWTTYSQAEIALGEAAGWSVSTDGRVNAFASHVWGDNRPEGLTSLQWVGFNETTSRGVVDSDNKIRATRIRSGYVPSTLAFNFRKANSENFKLWSRVEIGLQITNIEQTEAWDPTWMDPRSVFLDIAGNWGSVRAGRDFSLFARSNLFMNYELGHAYGLGFPCAFAVVNGGSCGHVGFGTLWPDFRAQISYTTPSIADIAELSVGVFDPRTVKTYEWLQTPLPRIESEAVAKYNFQEGWGFKAWANGFWQRVGTSQDVMTPDPVDPTIMTTERQDFTQDASGAGGGLQVYLGPVKAGFAGYTGKGIDAFSVLGFNPFFVGQDSMVPNRERRFRPTQGFLAELSVAFWDAWIMGGFGKAMFDRIPSDNPIDQVGAFPLLRSQTGISAGVFYRIDDVVLGLDYFNASYGFDPQLVEPEVPAGAEPLPPAFVDRAQKVQIVNAGVTLEW